MKKTIFLSLIVCALISVTSCKEEKKEQEKKSESALTIDTKTTSINWTAYKTTDKIPVKGTFTKFSIENPQSGENAKKAIDGIQFKIPVSSLFTKDTIRDGKLKAHFFGSMINTLEIKGKLNLTSDTSGTAEITMNGISQSLPISVVISGKMVTIEGVMNLDNWKAQSALEALNLVCKDLHTGPDGVSKTWSDVKINVVTYLKQE